MNDRARGWHTVTIDHIAWQTSRVASLFFREAPRSQRAGQHVDIRLTAPDGYQAQRSYSIASAPGSERLELAIERLDDGEVSPYLCDVAQPGDAIEMRGPIGGHFVWSARDGGPLLLVGGGSGVVPLMSMVRDRAKSAMDVPVLLLYSARTWEELIFRDELLTFHANEANFTFIVATTRGPVQRDGDFATRLGASQLRTALDRWGHVPRHAYVCGANAFVEAVTTALQAEGVSPAIMRAERYGGVT